MPFYVSNGEDMKGLTNSCRRWQEKPNCFKKGGNTDRLKKIMVENFLMAILYEDICTGEQKNWEWLSHDTMLSAHLRYKSKLGRQDAKKDSESSMLPVSEVVTSGNKSTLSDLTGERSVMLGREKGG